MPSNSRKNNSRNNKNTSRKSTVSVSVVVKTDEGDFASILLPTKKPSSRRTTPVTDKAPVSPPVSPRPEFLEPLSPTPLSPPTPPPSPWETLGMVETDYHAMMGHVMKQYSDGMRKTYVDNLLDEMDHPSYWLRRIEQLEKEREYFNKKRGWSAAEIFAVEKIDAEIQECQEELDSMEDSE